MSVREPHKQKKEREVQVKAVANTKRSYSRSNHVTATQTDLDVMSVFAAASPQIRQLALELLSSSKEETAQIFLTRAIRVLLNLLPSHAAVEAASASTDYGECPRIGSKDQRVLGCREQGALRPGCDSG